MTLYGRPGRTDSSGMPPLPPPHRHCPAPWVLASVLGTLGSLVWAGPASAGPLADALLRSGNFKVRLKAATELGKSTDPQGVAALSRALQDEAPIVRAAAANSLAQLGAREAMPDLCKLRDDPDDLVKTMVLRALDTFGGASTCDAAPRIFVEISVTGPDETLRRYVETQLLQRAAQDNRITLGRTVDDSGQGADPRAEAQAGRMPGVSLQLKLATAVEKTPSETHVRCQLGQTVFEINKTRILRGSATQSGEIMLGSNTVSDQVVEGQKQDCVSALVPVVYQGFGEFLKGRAK